MKNRENFHRENFQLVENVENKIIQNEVILATLLCLRKNNRMDINELVRELSIREDQLEPKIAFLEEYEYIKQNPSCNRLKTFKDKKYVLGIKGVFLINKLARAFPDHLNTVLN